MRSNEICVIEMAHMLLIGSFMQNFCTLEFLSLQRAIELNICKISIMHPFESELDP